MRAFLQTLSIEIVVIAMIVNTTEYRHRDQVMNAVQNLGYAWRLFQASKLLYRGDVVEGLSGSSDCAPSNSNCNWSGTKAKRRVQHVSYVTKQH